MHSLSEIEEKGNYDEEKIPMWLPKWLCVWTQRSNGHIKTKNKNHTSHTIHNMNESINNSNPHPCLPQQQQLSHPSLVQFTNSKAMDYQSKHLPYGFVFCRRHEPPICRETNTKGYECPSTLPKRPLEEQDDGMESKRSKTGPSYTHPYVGIKNDVNYLLVQPNATVINQ